MKVLSEETGFGDVIMLNKSHKTRLFLDERILCYVLKKKHISLCLERNAV